MAVRMFLTWCERQGLTSVLDVTHGSVLRWVSQRMTEVGVSTIVSQAGYLRRFFEELKSDGVIAVNPVPMSGQLRLFVSRGASEPDRSGKPSRGS
jgi:hypothetical protein